MHISVVVFGYLKANLYQEFPLGIKNQDVNICQTSILNGIPAQEIINYAQKYNIDLIILGSRNKSKIDRFLMGSVSKRVLENVKSDVWLIRCKS